MNRAEFMERLERLLMDIPKNDRQDAIDYYNDYFDEAGAENEAAVMGELGSPEKVAAMIKGETREEEEGKTRGEEEPPRPSRDEKPAVSPARVLSVGMVLLLMAALACGAATCVGLGFLMAATGFMRMARSTEVGFMTAGAGFLMLAAGVLLALLLAIVTVKLLPKVFPEAGVWMRNLRSGHKDEEEGKE